MTTRYHGYIIGDKNNAGQDASLRIEMGNVGLGKLLNNLRHSERFFAQQGKVREVREDDND